MKLKLIILSGFLMGAGSLLTSAEITVNPCEAEFSKCEKERASGLNRFVSYHKTCAEQKKDCNKSRCEQAAESMWQVCNKSGDSLYGSKACDREKTEVFNKCMKDAGLKVVVADQQQKPCDCSHKHDHKEHVDYHSK